MGSVHACLAPTAPSRMNSTLIINPPKAGQGQLLLGQEWRRVPAECFDLLCRLKMGPVLLPPTLRLK